ncbi:MAG: undecaprenyl-diphosphate phosphatase [Sphingomonadales bacterium]
MSLLHLIILAIVQGITEFLPISSSGHLILIPELTGWQDQGLVIDVAAHLGTLGAVLIYFWRDTRGLTLAMFGALGIRAARRRLEGSHYTRLFWLLALATLPVVGAGLIFVQLGLADALRRADVIGAASILFGLLLYYVDQRSAAEKEIKSLGLRAALTVGLAQVLALVPGTSRAGITMTAARALGFRRDEAAHFSMLLAIPTILAAAALGIWELAAQEAAAPVGDGLLVAALAFLTALGAIHFLMRWLQTASMTIFVAYRVVLGAALLAWVYY